MLYKITLWILAIVGIAVSTIAVVVEGFSVWNLTGVLFSIPLFLDK